MTGDEALERAARQIDCPVEWCAGGWLEHGGGGQSPEDWVHQDALGFNLPFGAHLDRDQQGTGPVTWMLSLECDGVRSPVRSDADIHALASMLRRLADAVDDVGVIAGR